VLLSIKKLIGRRRQSVIVPARQEDLSALSLIHTESFSRGWSDGEFEALLAQDNYFCLVARKPGAPNKGPSGFVLFKAVAEEAEIITIATKASARKKGVAGRLMDEAIRQLEHDRINALFLEVDAENTAAIGLYQKLGFKQVGTREGYYSSQNNANPSPALVMQLDLG